MEFNKKIARFVDVLSDVDIPGLIMSPPGLGKTSTIQMYCKVKGYHLCTLIASQYAADDILGIQAVKDGKLQRLTPSWYDSLMEGISNSREKRAILFIDELTTCEPFIQAPLLNLIFNKSLGEHDLPEDTIIVAAGNYIDNLEGFQSLSAPVINRFVILNLNKELIDPKEIFSNEFESVYNSGSEDSMGKFLSLHGDGHPISSAEVDIMKEAFEKSILNCDLKTVEPKVTNSTSTGLIGFVSVRSLSNCSKYGMGCITKGYHTILSPVVSDTLGEFTKGITFEEEFKKVLIRVRSSNSNRLKNDYISVLRGLDIDDSEDTYQKILEFIRQIKMEGSLTDELTEVLYSTKAAQRHRSRLIKDIYNV